MSDELHPAIATMEPEEVAILAAACRSMGLHATQEANAALQGHSDKELASSLLALQDNGLVSLGWDGGEQVNLVLHNPDNPKSPRKGKRRSMRRPKW